MRLTIIFGILLLFCSSAIVDGTNYWTIKLNDKLVYDTREIENYSRWDYHTMKLKTLNKTDTLILNYHGCTINPNAIENFLLVNPKNKEIVREFKYLGFPRLTISTFDLLKEIDLKEVDIFHYQSEADDEAMRILKIKRE